MTILEGWRDSWRGRSRVDVIGRIAHDHYCAAYDHDHRWPCRVDPCLLHEAAPCVAALKNDAAIDEAVAMLRAM